MRRNGSVLIATLGAMVVAAALFATAAATTGTHGPAAHPGVLAADTPWGDGLAPSPSPSR